MATTNSAFEELKTRIRDEGIFQGILQGRDEGLAPLVHMFERKLQRTLAEPERTTLRERLMTHGSLRLGDVVLDLDADALDAWLRDPAAR